MVMILPRGIGKINCYVCSGVTGDGGPMGINTISGCVCLSGDTKACWVKDQSDKMLSFE